MIFIALSVFMTDNEGARVKMPIVKKILALETLKVIKLLYSFTIIRILIH